MSRPTAQATELESLLRDARRDGPSEKERQALVATVMGALGSSGAVTDGGGTVANGIPKERSRPFTPKRIALVTGGITGAVALGIWIGTQPPKAGEVFAPAEQALSADPDHGAPRGEPTQATPPSSLSTASLPSANTADRDDDLAPPGALKLEPPAQRGLSRASEAGLIEDARRVLAKDPNRALRLVAQHRRLYPSGVLRQEAEVVEIEALARLGRAGEAERRASSFRRRNPHSIYEQRLRAALGEGEVPSAR